MAHRFCSSCGSPLEAGAKFCAACGHQAPEEVHGPESAAPNEVPVPTGSPVVGIPAPMASAPVVSAVPAGPPSGPPSVAPVAPTASVAYVQPVAPPPAPSRPSKNLLIGLIAAAVLLIGGIVIFATRGDDEGSTGPSTTRRTTTTKVVPSTTTPTETTTPGETTVAPATTVAAGGEVLLEALDTEIPDAFTTSVATAPATEITVPLPELDLPVAPDPDQGTPLLGINGDQPGLYGGTRDAVECDAQGLIAFLEANPDKAAAWAGVQDIAVSDIRPFVESLTPVVLTRDTRVTNHGFKDGKAVAHQSILRAGHAVLVDRYGVPRAKCSCGNPLSPPIPTTTTPTYTGSWPGFDPANVVVVTPATQITVIILIDIVTGVPFGRPVAEDGPDQDVSVEGRCELFPDDPACTTIPPEQQPLLFDNHNPGGVENGPSDFPVFEVIEPTVIAYVQTYHWNNGQGAPAGQIWVHSLVDESVYGPWEAVGSPGQGGVPDAYWTVTPGVVVPAGTYQVLDSDPATWSWNDATFGVGLTVVRGYPEDGIPDQELTGDVAIAILDGVLRGCGYDITTYADNGPSGEGRSIIASTPYGDAEFIVISTENIQVNDQTAADIAVECGFYEP